MTESKQVNQELQPATLDLEEAFKDAAEAVASAVASNDLTKDQQLEYYGLYKQATCGPCSDFRPSFFDIKARTKWAAWKHLDEMSKDQAKIAYIQLAQPLFAWGESLGDRDRQGKSALGPVVSTMAAEELEDERAPAWESLQIKASEGDAVAVQDLLEEGADVNGRDTEGCCALHWASDRGSIQVVELLLSRGGSPNARDSDGQTPLHYAALCGHREVISCLLQSGADPSATDFSGKTAADLADQHISRFLNQRVKVDAAGG